uniref:Ribosome maturation factor RimP n=1 Tax=uncultured myxobacterium HF0200_01L06 TaxID=723556 RepID=E7C3G6_9BACT|nr:uncharacterized protein conserved in bacteria [uncultured myxobacterium HF0200_01L06]
MYRDIPEELRTLIEPVLEDHGCELVDTIVLNRPKVVRIIIDRASEGRGVGIDLCAEISREVGTQLDAAEAIEGSYRLEVSSPGLHRVLSREKDFRAACGQNVNVTTKGLIDGRRRFNGQLLEFGDGLARVEVDGVRVGIPFDQIEKANLVYEFAASDFDNRMSKTAGKRP